MADENFNEEIPSTEGNESIPQTEEANQTQPRDYSADFSELKRQNERLQENNQRFLSDLDSHKQELAKLREAERRRNLILAGDDSVLKEEQEKRKQSQIRDQLLKVAPELKSLFTGEQPQQSGQPSMAEMAFFNQARSSAQESLKARGFEDQTAQEALLRLGDVLIHDVPQWHDRFYKQGDMRVLKEVENFLFEKLFDPYSKRIEAQTIERIKKQGRFTTPIPQRGSGSGNTAPKKNEKFDVNNQADRLRGFSNLYGDAVASE